MCFSNGVLCQLATNLLRYVTLVLMCLVGMWRMLRSHDAPCWVVATLLCSSHDARRRVAGNLNSSSRHAPCRVGENTMLVGLQPICYAELVSS